MTARIQHTFMLGRHGNDMFFLITVKTRHTFNRNIVRLRSTRSEHNFFRIGTNHIRHLLTRSFAGILCFPAIRMAARMWITKFLGKIRQHRLHHTWICWCSRLIIQINWKLNILVSNLTHAAFLLCCVELYNSPQMRAIFLASFTVFCQPKLTRMASFALFSGTFMAVST